MCRIQCSMFYALPVSKALLLLYVKSQGWGAVEGEGRWEQAELGRESRPGAWASMVASGYPLVRPPWKQPIQGLLCEHWSS